MILAVFEHGAQYRWEVPSHYIADIPYRKGWEQRSSDERREAGGITQEQDHGGVLTFPFFCDKINICENGFLFRYSGKGI